MGAGKTTVGKKLAKLIDYAFVDLDQYIENKEQQTIPNLFRTKGEDVFRRIETHTLKNLNIDNSVIALGGGTPCFNNNIELINQKGLSIYLQLPPKTLVNRLIHSKTKRPLIDAYKTQPDLLLDKIENLLSEREPFYLKADIIFNANNMNSVKIEQLLQQIETYFLSF